MTSPKVIAVVPAFREEKSIGIVVEALKPRVAEIIVVEDCSPDATAEVAERAGAVVIRREEKGGYDVSLNDGFKEASRRGADIILTFDADGEHGADEVPKILAPILEGKADIVAGQRPSIRHWGEWIFAIYTRFRWGIPDPLCGFKAYTRASYDAVGFFDSVRSIGTELMLRGAKKGFRVVCMPITLHERLDGGSRFYSINVRGNVRIVRALFRVLIF